MFMPPLRSFPAPETPLEPMEFLSRSWSISSVDVARSLQLKSQHSHGSLRALEPGSQHTSLEDPTLCAPFTFASTLTSQMVMDRLMAPGSSSEPSPFVSRRNSYSSGSLALLSPPVSPRTVEDYKFRRSFSMMKAPLSGRSMSRWIKDLKTKKKEATRCQNAQVHAAVSVAGVAAAIAAVTAATAASAQEDSSKTSMAVASAAALVAAQCVEVAESIGADRDHMASIVSSAVNVRSAGDILTLTASAATSLRGAATLRARRMKEARSLAAVTPYERAAICPSITFGGQDTENESETEYNCHDVLARGAEFLKWSKTGDLHWRNVFIYLNKVGQVTVRLQSKHMRGALTKNKKSIIFQVFSNIRAWPGRNILEGSENRRYFALRTSSGDMEFECRNKEEHQVWTEGISRLLYISSQCRRR